MGSSKTIPDLLAEEPAAAPGVPFARFMELALYHPEAGYYARERTRVGRDRAADFYTATSLGPVFGELVAASAVALLGERAAGEHEFVEIGAEPGGGVLRDLAHPFAGYRTVGLREEPRLDGRCVVFSNELFDAQPFHRVVRRDGAWRETGVAVSGDGLREVELPALSPEVAAVADRLPPEAPEGYRLDLPLRATGLADSLAGGNWTGLFLAFDYGRSWGELCREYPGGTARAYHRQRHSAGLLACPGEQDLTCHICWDWLVDSLRRRGFTRVAVESQEAFLARRAGAALAGILAAEGGRFSARKQALQHLLHPANMGQKFQVMSGLR
jgi:SAM-dependent MidA family methyltransferase